MIEDANAGMPATQGSIATTSVVNAYAAERDEVLADLAGDGTPDLETVEANVLRRLTDGGFLLDEAVGRIRASLLRQGMQDAEAECLIRRIVAAYRTQVLFSSAIDMRILWDEDLPDLDMALPGLMVGTYGLLVGAGGGCKSTWSALASMSVATGRNILGLLPEDAATGVPFRPTQGRATFLNLEDHERPLRKRLQLMLRARRDGYGDYILPEADRLEIIHAQQHGQLCILPRPRDSLAPFALDDRGRVVKTRDFDVLEGIAAQSRILFIDTLNILISSAGIEENSNTQMGPVASALNRLAEETECAIVIPHHPSKADAMNGTTDGGGRGASATRDNSRFCLTMRGMTRDEGKERWPGLEGVEIDRMRRQWVHAEWNKTSYSEVPYPMWIRRSGVILEGVRQDQVPQPVPREERQERRGAGRLPAQI